MAAITLRSVTSGAGPSSVRQAMTTSGSCSTAFRPGRMRGPASTPFVRAPCIVAADLRSDARWPVYGPRAVESAGVLSSMGYPLDDGTQVIGALNLFSEQVDAFGADEPDREGTVAILVAHGTPALMASLLREEFGAALARRDVIGQAKGWLMARSQIGEDEAFEMLVKASQRMNVKLAEVARRLVSGEPLHPDGEI